MQPATDPHPLTANDGRAEKLDLWPHEVWIAPATDVRVTLCTKCVVPLRLPLLHTCR